MKNILYIIFFFSWSFFCSQQSFSIKEIDSLFSLYNKPDFINQDKNQVLLYNQLYYQSKDIGYTKGQINALLQTSVLRLKYQKEFDQVILNTDEAENLSEKIGDFRNVTKAQTLKGKAYLYLGLSELAKKELNTALKTSTKITDTEHKHFARFSIFTGYSNYFENQYSVEKNTAYIDSCIFYLKEMYTEAEMMGKSNPIRTKCLLTSLKSLSGMNLTAERYKEAEYYLNLQKKYINLKSDKFSLATYHKLKAEFEFMNVNNNKHFLDSSMYHFKKAEYYAKEINNIQLLDLIYPEMANVFDKMNDVENQVKYLENATFIRDSIQKNEKKSLEKIDPQIILSSDKGGGNTVKEKNKKLLILGLVFGIIGALAFFYTKKKISRRNVMRCPQKYTENTMINNKAEENINFSIDDFLLLAYQNNGTFLAMFQEYFMDFKEKLLLVNPAINDSDLELCAFIKLNFDTKKISTILNISVRATESKKYRLRKKLSILPNEDLYVWISRL